MSFKLNPLFGADAYKYGHIRFYPKGITEVYSNFTPRSVKHLNIPEEYKTNEIVWVGGQALVQDMVELWEEEFLLLSDVEEALSNFVRVIAPFVGGEYDVSHLRALHKLGYLPLEIKTLPEGSRVPVGIPVLTVRNTLPEYYWLTNFIESYLSTEGWKMSTSATIADYYRKILTKWSDITDGNKDFIDFQAHDFSYRGMSGSLDAAKSGAGHLFSFKGTDTIPAVQYLEYHYSGKETFIGASVPATEHSIQTAFVEDDYEYIRHIIQDCVPSGIVSVVADGYDYWGVLTDVLPKLKNVIMNRTPNALGFAKTVIRPDSGDPVRIVAGYRYIEAKNADDLESIVKNMYYADEYDYARDAIVKIDGKYYRYTWGVYDDGAFKGVKIDFERQLTEEEIKGSVQVLWDLFGGTLNEKGYKTLDPHIGLIYGDSITLQRADEILKRLADKGFASDNIVFGVGSYTYQYNTRDTLGFAMKATNIVKDGVSIPLFKDPKTDDGTKKSAKGLLAVGGGEEGYKLFNDVSRVEENTGYLTTLYKDGLIVKHDKLADIRARLLD